MKKVGFIIGARPQFIKHAPVELAMKKYFDVFSIHTGQHYDEKMSDIFFNQLKIDKPKYALNIGSYSHGKQTGIMLQKIEEVLILEKPDAVIVYGDTNSTLSGALAASKLNISIIHIEAGLRSFNKQMPEETNRVLTDHMSDMLFAPSKDAMRNLKHEGINKCVYHTGDVMYDTLLMAKRVLGNSITEKKQILVTLHRPYNTDNVERLKNILSHLDNLKYKVVFPIHPRTKNILIKNSFDFDKCSNILFTDPVSYFELVKLLLESIVVVTDSGGIQKEAYLLKKKCITLRSETEWKETLLNGWNTLLFNDFFKFNSIIDEILGEHIENIYGNGKAAEEIVKIIYHNLYKKIN